MSSREIEELFLELKIANERASNAEIRRDTAERILNDIRQMIISDRNDEWGEIFRIMGLVICPISHLKDEFKP